MKWDPDSYSKINSWGHRWEPRSKTVTAVCFIVGIVSLKTLWLVMLALIIVLTAALSMRLPLKFLVARLAWVLPFIILMGVTLVVGGGFPLSQERLVFAGLICFKAFTSVLVMIITVGTQSLKKHLDGLAHMGIPPLIISVLFLAYRYVFLFRDELKGIKKAMSARNFHPRTNKKSLKTYGELTGGLLIRAVDRSESVHRAMLARGFDGRINSSKPDPVSWSDILKSAAVIVLTLLLVFVERGWIN